MRPVPEEGRGFTVEWGRKVTFKNCFIAFGFVTEVNGTVEYMMYTHV